jgi:hypothetical protein
MTWCSDYLDLHRPNSDSIAVFELAAGEYGRSFFGKEYRSARSGRQLGVTSYKIGVRMHQKNVPQLETILGEMSQVSVYVPLWIHNGSLTSRCDDVRNVRQARDQESLDMHQASFRIDLRCNPLLSEKEQGGSASFV